MIEFPLYEVDTAPEASRPDLEALTRTFGFLPNHPKILAESPAALRAYRMLNELVGTMTFTPMERQVLLVAISVEQRCEYCVSAHTTLLRMARGSDQIIHGLRTRTSTGDVRLDALIRFIRIMVEKRGWAEEAEVQAFLDAGFTREQVFEVITAISLKTLTTYANHLAGTPLDDAFAADRWSASESF